MSITLRIIVLPVLLGLLSAASPVALAQDHTPLPDRQIQNLIEHRLLEKKISGVTVSVAGGVVTLAGAVPVYGRRTRPSSRLARLTMSGPLSAT